MAENWAKETAGRSGIRAISRFPTEGLRTRIGGAIDFLLPPGFTSPDLCYALAERAATEAIAQSGIALGRIPRSAVHCGRAGRNRMAASPRARRRAHQRRAAGYAALIDSTFGHRSDLHNLLRLSGVADRVADRFGTQGSPISINTACASGATAIHMGVEAIRRGETDAALAVGADGSIDVQVADPLFAALRRSRRATKRPRRRRGRSRRAATASSWPRAAARWCSKASQSARRARRRDSRRRRGLRRTRGFLPPHAQQPRRLRDHRRDPQRARRRRRRARRNRLHQRPRHQHAGE